MKYKHIKKGLVLGLVIVLVAAMFATILPMNVGAEEESAPLLEPGSNNADELIYGEYEPCEVEELGTVYIKSDGTVDPGTAPISVSGSTYTMTGDILDNMVIEKSGITLDGDGYSVEGTGAGFAVYGTGLMGVTVMDVVVEDFFVGIRFDYSSDITITGNTVSDIARGGIVFWGTSGGMISKNTVSNCGYGIVLYTGASKNVVCDNMVYDCNVCISMEQNANYNMVKGNTLKNGFYGVTMYYCIGNVFKNNVQTDAGFVLWGELLMYWNTHDIDTSNMLNGNPVYYWKDKTGGIVPSGAGQVILANCSNIYVKYQNIYDCGAGIAIAFSTKCQIYKNTVQSRSYGIFLESSDWNREIKSNTVSCYGSGWAIYLLRSDNNRVHHNTVSVADVGIRTYNAFYNRIDYNKVSECYTGIEIYYDGDNLINHNCVSDCTYGIRTTNSDDNVLTCNNIMECWIGFNIHDSANLMIKCNTATSCDMTGIGVWDSVDCEITYNKVYKNSMMGIYVDSSENILIKSNTAGGNGLGIGLYMVEDCLIKCNIVKDNTISYMYNNGMLIMYCSEIILESNVVMYNGGHGILIMGTSDFEVKYCKVMYNSGDGVHVEDSDDGVVRSSTVKYNSGYDLYWDESGTVIWIWLCFDTMNW